MSEYNFKKNERYATYKAFDGKCQWCSESVEFKNTHIDHVIPEVLLKNPNKLAHILKSYGLDDKFNLNNFENWAPLHPNCNVKKNAAVYEGLGIIKTLLDKCEKNKEKAEKIKTKLDREPKKTEILVRIENALEKGIINSKELQTLLLEHNIEDVTEESHSEMDKLIKLGLLTIPDKTRWKVARILNDYEAIVTDGERGGIIPTSDSPDISWLCASCLSFGPWNGNQCLTCGRFSNPY